jgi:hypothetical protein
LHDLSSIRERSEPKAQARATRYSGLAPSMERIVVAVVE